MLDECCFLKCDECGKLLGEGTWDDANYRHFCDEECEQKFDARQSEKKIIKRRKHPVEPLDPYNRRPKPQWELDPNGITIYEFNPTLVSWQVTN